MTNKAEKYINKKDYHRIAGAVYIGLTAVYLIWLAFHLNLSVWWLSYPYFVLQTYLFLLVTLSIINHWKASYRIQRPTLPTPVPSVAVVVPTYQEPVGILKRTVKSLLHLYYPGRMVIVVSNDDQNEKQVKAIEKMVRELAIYWQESLARYEVGEKSLYLRHSTPHHQAKAGNLNQAAAFLKQHFPDIDLLLTQDADEVAYPDLLLATIGYFSNPKVAYVQTVKQAKVAKDDPFGNCDFVWYGRTAACRDADNAMFACGSAVVWRLSAVNLVGGFATWNLVEDLTTSYELLSAGWESRYHYEVLSIGLAPEDLSNYIKQRGTWAIDSLRLFFWKNPLFRRGLSFKQKRQFLETSLFYLNGTITMGLILVTSLSLFFTAWPTTASAKEHALLLLPSFLAMEGYFVLLSGGIPFRRVRQFWAGMAPVFALAALKALFYGPNRKPKYIVTKKENAYNHYLKLVWPQMAIVALVGLALVKTIISTPLYSAFDWAIVFWGFYQASFFLQVIKVSLHKWEPRVNFELDTGLSSHLIKTRLLLKQKLAKIDLRLKLEGLPKPVEFLLNSIQTLGHQP